ncbi:MAG: ATP synthase F1 subunit epsilon [Pirellulales bacterium]|nr:ATP synthase F1 subunit epsilon [Pirellulales bacterium]
MAKAQSIQVIVVTPETTLLDTTAEFVALPLYDGELGVAPGHAPFIGRLGYGELRVAQAGGGQSYYVDGGFAQVAGDVVSLLTNYAAPAAQLDLAAAQRQLADITARPAKTDEQIQARLKAQEQARAKIRLAGKR